MAKSEEEKKQERTTVYNWYKSKGLCPGCGGQEEAVEGKVYGPNCLDKQALCQMQRRAKMTLEERRAENKKYDYVRLKTRNERKANGLCVRCGKHKARPGKLNCERCAAIIAEKSKEAHNKK